MKKFILLLALVLMVSSVMAQTTPNVVSSVFIPKNKSNAAMSARTLSTTSADTTEAITVRNWSKVYIGVVCSLDSANILFQYSISNDGVNYNAFTTYDSLVATTSAATYVQKWIEFPAAVMGAYAVKWRVAGQAHGQYSANPSCTVTTYIVKKHH